MEFTGERVVPGLVNEDLWAEHIARYAFATRLAAGKRVLDAGCGAGYGTAELSSTAALAVGTDIALLESWRPAAASRPKYCQASVEAMPFPASSFDLVVAFEVIEHLHDWRALLQEARRVLAPGGSFVVSTPNRVYYTESRGAGGPNPFHVHEFDFEEFSAALREFFPKVDVWVQNRLEAFVFDAGAGGSLQGFAAKGAAREEAHFFIGICGVDVAPYLRPFVYVPRAANLLRERERHIRMLEQDVERQIAEHAKLQQAHQSLTEHLEQQNRWALSVEQNWRAAQKRIVELQEELETTVKAYQKELDAQNRDATARLAARAEELAATVRLLDRAEATVIERTSWAQRLDAELARAKEMLEMIRQSRWLKLGRTVGLGPKL
ncbi:MAG TPA: methyltransferase domain-containing protein [Bryobacteraceae bacterium]|nr:methyltransferase domain-containing protein [Bryobacteraceae bacterium]